MLKHRIIASLLFTAALACAQSKSKQEYGTGWMGEFNYTADEAISLAEKTPADKFSWRPAEGVRSISEVYVHIAVAHYFFLNSCGAKVDMSKVTRDAEKKMTSKADVVKFLKESITAVKENYPKLDLQKKVHFQDADTNVEGVMIHLIAHTSEHVGQSIAYARMNGIVPPWSEPAK